MHKDTCADILPCYDKESLLTSVMVSLHSLSSPFGHSPLRRLSPQEKQETADMDPVNDAHTMLIDRWLPRVSHIKSGFGA